VRQVGFAFMLRKLPAIRFGYALVLSFLMGDDKEMGQTWYLMDLSDPNQLVKLVERVIRYDRERFEKRLGLVEYLCQDKLHEFLQLIGYVVLPFDPPYRTDSRRKPKYADIVAVSKENRHFLWFELKTVRGIDRYKKQLNDFFKDIQALKGFNKEKTATYWENESKKKNTLIKEFINENEGTVENLREFQHILAGIGFIITFNKQDLPEFEKRLETLKEKYNEKNLEICPPFPENQTRQWRIAAYVKRI
jgi:GTPase SAR1 family protein